MIVNFKDYGSVEALNAAFVDWRYVGRENKHYGLQRSVLANPYSIKQAGSRKNAIELYRRWLWEHIDDEAVQISLNSLNDDTVLVCWCAPRACHAEVIERARAYLGGS